MRTGNISRSNTVMNKRIYSKSCMSFHFDCLCHFHVFEPTNDVPDAPRTHRPALWILAFEVETAKVLDGQVVVLAVALLVPSKGLLVNIWNNSTCLMFRTYLQTIRCNAFSQNALKHVSRWPLCITLVWITLIKIIEILKNSIEF